MKNLKSEISDFLEKDLTRDFFLHGESEEAQRNIGLKIASFTSQNPKLIESFHSNLRTVFPDWTIENYTQFFNNDRCIRFLLQKDEVDRYVAQLSIYGYFSIYQRTAKLVDGLFQIGDVNFIDQNENEYCDKVYTCIQIEKDQFIPWLEKDILNHVMESFSENIPEINHRYDVTIADALFTDHYI